MADETSLKVLVAEDEPAMLSLVARHLRSLGFSVVEASEGDVAWELAQRHRPDLVILDVMMPGMSGWEICKRLKGPAADSAFADTGVIMLTGIGENLNEMTSPLFKADAWLNKPFDFKELDARIHETLGRYSKAVPVSNGVASFDAESDEGVASGPVLTSPAARGAGARSPSARARKPAKKVAARASKGRNGASRKPAKKSIPKKASKASPAKKSAPKKAKPSSKKKSAARPKAARAK
jgi:DNA-binding response OmpR family regulator